MAAVDEALASVHPLTELGPVRAPQGALVGELGLREETRDTPTTVLQQLLRAWLPQGLLQNRRVSRREAHDDARSAHRPGAGRRRGLRPHQEQLCGL